MKYCCQKFEEQASETQAMIGGGFIYPKEMKPNSQFELSEDGKSWNINGCCGGGCFVVTGMAYCPYCGTKLKIR